MKLKLRKVEVPPAGSAHRGHGWSKVFVHAEDEEIGMCPSVTIEVHVPYDQSDTYATVRGKALERARELLRFAATTLEGADVTDLEKTAAGVR